jgi:signal peptidase I
MVKNLRSFTVAIKVVSSNPWISIWLHPRATIRQITAGDSKTSVAILAILVGWVAVVEFWINQNISDYLPWGALFIAVLLIGSLGGLIFIYLSGHILQWTGQLLGGQGSAGQVQAALAWSAIPNIARIVLNLLFLHYIRTGTLSSATSGPLSRLATTLSISQLEELLIFGLGILNLILVVWQAAVYLKCIGEVHGFSAWRALIATAIPLYTLPPIFTPVLALILTTAINIPTARVRVDSPSMEPTLRAGDFVLINKLAYKFGDLGRGDVVLINLPSAPGEYYIKRIIGLPGDNLEISNGVVEVNGVVLDEPYIHGSTMHGGTWTVPEEAVFVMGDNRESSADSRVFGHIAVEHIVGRVSTIYWPPTSWR